jgi:DNA-binding transcriptional ArsR family regulator
MVELSLDATYAALGHPIRRELLSRLSASDASVTELAAPFDVSLAAVSKHIRVLEDARLVHREVVGREHHLSIEAKPLREAASWLETYRRFWDQRLDALDHMLREKRR